MEDDPDLRRILKLQLLGNDFTVAEAENGAEGVNMAREQSPDLVTLDMTMPEQSGVKSYRQLKDDAELAKIPVIIITAVGEPMEHFLKTRKQVPNPEGFMAKPIDQSKLLQMIANAVLVFICHAGEGMLHHRFPGDFAEDFVEVSS